MGILGLTFKENVADLRNSKVPDIVAELAQFGIEAMVADPLASPEHAEREYGIALADLDALCDLDGLILAVAHEPYLAHGTSWYTDRLRPGGVFIDVKSVIDPASISDATSFWSL